MWLAETLGQVERPFELVVLSFDGALVAALATPHARADLKRFLQHLEALTERWEGNSQSARLVLETAGSDAEPCVPAGEHVQCGYGLGQEARVPKGHGRDERQYLGPRGVCGDERKHRVALQHVALRPTMNGVRQT